MSKFIINSTDLTSQINDKTSYKVNSAPVYTSIKDANGVEYRNPYRNKISGSFEMFFVTGYGTEYSDFLTLLANNTANGVLLCTIYVQNLAESKAISCFCTVTIKKENEVNGKTVRIAQIKIEEC